MNLNFTLSQLIFVCVGTLISVYYFTEIYSSTLPIFILILIFTIIAIMNLKKFFVTNLYLLTLIILVFMFMYFFLNKDNGVIKEINPYTDSVTISNFALSTLLITYIYLIFYFYSLQLKDPIKIFSKIFALQILIFIFYIFWIRLNSESEFNLGIGFLVYLSAPYILLAFQISKKKVLLLYIFLAFFLLIISARGSLLALTVFFLNYYLYPFIKKKKFLSTLVFFINLLIIFLFMHLYIKYADSHILNEISLKYFNKAFNTGRVELWNNLLEIANQKLLLGYGSDQSSSFIEYKTERGIKRSMAVHNLYLELILIGGFIALILFICLFYLIWLQFFRSKENYWGRLGSSYLISILYASISGTYIFKGNIVFITFFWMFLAVAIAQTKVYENK